MEKKKSAVFKLFVATILASNLVGCLVGGVVVYTIANHIVEESEQEYIYENIDASEPLDCPFCGGEAKICESDWNGYQACVECKECHISTKYYSSVTMNEAIRQALKAWNLRISLKEEYYAE